MKVVGRKTGATVMGLAKAKSLILHPENATHISCTTRLLELVPVWSGAILAEFDNKKKASYWNLLISDSPIFFKNCKDDEKQLLLGIKCVNDDSERSFAGTTMNFQRGNKISIHHAAAVSDAKFNIVPNMTE